MQAWRGSDGLSLTGCHSIYFPTSVLHNPECDGSQSSSPHHVPAIEAQRHCFEAVLGVRHSTLPKIHQHSKAAICTFLGQDVAAVSMHIVEFLIKAGDVGPALHRAGAGARQVLALPQSPEAGAGATAGVEGLSRGINVATVGTVALLQGQAAQMSDIIQHSSWGTEAAIHAVVLAQLRALGVGAGIHTG